MTPCIFTYDKKKTKLKNQTFYYMRKKLQNQFKEPIRINIQKVIDFKKNKKVLKNMNLSKSIFWLNFSSLKKFTLLYMCKNFCLFLYFKFSSSMLKVIFQSASQFYQKSSPYIITEHTTFQISVDTKIELDDKDNELCIDDVLDKVLSLRDSCVELEGTPVTKDERGHYKFEDRNEDSDDDDL